MTCRADLKICGTKNFYPMILVLKSIILSVLRYMRVIPGVFGAFWVIFGRFHQAYPKNGRFSEKRKIQFFNFFALEMG